jgi:hypothetical protein
MRFRLRTLLILLAVGPPLLAGAWWLTPTTIADPGRVNWSTSNASDEDLQEVWRRMEKAAAS